MARDLFVAERTFGDRRASDAGVWPRSAKGQLEPTARRHVNGRNRRIFRSPRENGHSQYGCPTARFAPERPSSSTPMKARVGGKPTFEEKPKQGLPAD
jgi:hypothetical protein